MHFAASKNSLSTVRKLLSNQCSARVRDSRGQLPLHRAAAVGSVPILRHLIDEGKSPLNATDLDGLAALHHAILEGHGEAALVLLRAGAEADKRDSDGRLPIDLAPDPKVNINVHGFSVWASKSNVSLPLQVRSYILQSAERDGIELLET